MASSTELKGGDQVLVAASEAASIEHFKQLAGVSAYRSGGCDPLSRVTNSYQAEALTQMIHGAK